MIRHGSSQVEFIRPKKAGLSLDMAPLIDIVFQLLIFFMLSSSFMSPALKLNLPQAVKQDPMESERVVVSIDEAGNTFLNTASVSLAELKPRLESLMKKDSKKAIHVRGDQEMPYKFFVEVMDAARQAGARQINVVHQSGNKR